MKRENKVILSGMPTAFRSFLFQEKQAVVILNKKNGVCAENL